MKLKLHDIFTLDQDIGSEIKKGMEGVILEIYNDGEAYEVEFVKPDGSNYEHNGHYTFTINPSMISKSKPAPLNPYETPKSQQKACKKRKAKNIYRKLFRLLFVFVILWFVILKTSSGEGPSAFAQAIALFVFYYTVKWIIRILRN